MPITANKRSARPVLVALVLLMTVALSVVLTSRASGARVLGSARMAKASCPDNCLVEAKVTGFQLAINGRKGAFRAPGPGRLLAWTIKLGAPRGSDIKFFNHEFGPSAARLAILKPVRVKPKKRSGKRWKKGKLKYRLMRQGPPVNLKPFFGRRVTFALPHRLKIGKGQIVALTISSWAPVFSASEPMSSRWRASRVPKRGGCLVEGNRANIDSGAPQEQPRTLRAYRCVYRGTRLLYSATFVPSKPRRR